MSGRRRNTVRTRAFATTPARRFALAVLAWLAATLAPFGATAQERVRVEVERHENHARLVVAFPDRLTLPEYRVSTDNGVLVIAMAETAMSGVLPDIATILDDYIAVARFDPDMTGIRAGLRGPLRIHTMEAGEALYVDLLPTDWVGLPPGLPAEVVDRLARRAEDAARIAEERRRAEMVAEYDPQASIRIGRAPTFTRVELEWTVGTTAEFSREGEEARIHFDWPVPVDLYAVRSDPPPEIFSAENVVTPSGSTVTLTIPEGVDARFYAESGTRFVLDIDNPHAPRGGIDMGALEAMGAQAAAPPASTEGDAPVAAAAPERIVPFVNTVGSTVRIVFPFAEETAAAAFRRGNVVWMLIDTPTPIAMPDARSGELLDGLARDLSIEGSGTAQVVRMVLDDDRLATLGSEGRAWVLSLGETVLSATQPITLERRRTARGFDEIVTDLVRPSRVHQVRDPEVGDILDVVTAYPPAIGAVRDLSHVDFKVPRSIHGLVVQPFHDGVAVRIEDRLAVVSAQGGLTLSPARTNWAQEGGAGSTSAMDLNRAVAPNPAAFVAQRDEIFRRTIHAEGRELDHARLEMAQFYLANDFAQEALGVLSMMQAELRQADLAPAMNAAIAAARVLAGRPREALALLDAEPLRTESDAMIWRTIARAESGDLAGARRDAEVAAPIIAAYPGWLGARFHLAGARAGIEQQDLRFAREMLDGIEFGALTPGQLADFDLLTGMLDEREGRHADALESYGRVIAADQRPSRVEAVLRTIELLDAMGRLDLHRAIETLAVQASVWRGDSLELDVVTKLADLHYRAQDYRDALLLTQEVTTRFEEGPQVGALVEWARGAFMALFLDGKADALTAVEALGLYYDFRHLTPPGTEGDLMIRNLAQRLVKVDLLEQAASLLRYQIDNRLTGAAKAQIAADLAVIHIAERKPAEALGVLYETRLAGLPPTLDRQRRVLEASALIQANRQELALDMLSSLSGRDVEMLRIEAYWSGGRHRQASELIEGLYAPKALAGSLEPLERGKVLKAAVGYVLADDRLGLTRLRSRFSEVMANAPEWPLFALVTKDIDANAASFREVARQVADTDGIDAFLSAYRELYGGANGIVPGTALEDMTVATR